MNLEIEWFIYALVQNEVVTTDYCKTIYDYMDNPTLETFAQATLDKIAENVAASDLNRLAEQIQAVMEYAVIQAQIGSSPGLFASDGSVQKEAAPKPAAAVADLSQLPELNGVAKLPREKAAELLKELLTKLRDMGASDLHLSSASIPFIRRALKLERIGSSPLSAEDAQAINYSMMTPEQIEFFETNKDMNYSLEIGNSRFRVAAMLHKDGVSGSYRLVPDRIKALAELGFMEKDIPTIEKMLTYTNGLVLVTGPIGSGKTSTLASMVDIINVQRQDHIITVEDPIEIVQSCKNCQVTQREVGKHTANYHSALKGALREDPDIIVIGEMHDLETIENAITASETGHLVIGTLHTKDAASTLNRLLDVFPPNQQPQIRAMTAGSLRGVICQMLIPAKNGGLTLVYEILVNTMAVASLISDGKTFQLAASMQIGTKQGMCTLDQCILEKYKLDIIDYDVALSYMTDSAMISQIKQIYGTQQAKILAAANAANAANANVGKKR